MAKAISKVINRLIGRYTLQSQLRFYCLIFVILPSILIMLIFAINEKEDLEMDKENQLQSRIAIQQENVEALITERIGDVRNVAKLISFRPVDEQNIAYICKTVLESQKELYDVGYINKDGFVAISPRYSTGAYVGDRDYFKKALQGVDYVTDVVTGRNSGKNVVVITAPVYNNAGQVAGVIYGTMQAVVLNRMVQQFELGKTAEMYLVDADGIAITQTKGTELSKDAGSQQVLIETEAFRRAVKGESGAAVYKNYQGKMVVGAYQWIPERQWIIIEEIEQQEVLEPFYRQLHFILIGIGVVLITILPVTFILADRIKVPIEQVVLGLREMQQGNYQRSIDQEFFAGMAMELQELCQMFNYMGRTIQENFSQIMQTNAALLEAEAKYHSLVEQAFIGVYLVQQNKYVYVNPQFAKIFGYSQNELIDTNPQNTIFTDDLVSIEQSILNRKKEGEDAVYQARGVRKDGSIIYIEYFGKQTIYKGSPAIIGVLTDVTGRKQMEVQLQKHYDHLDQVVKERTQNLRETNKKLLQEIGERQKAAWAVHQSEELYRTLVEQASDGIFLTDPMGNCIEVNTSGCFMLGYSREELLNMDVIDIMTGGSNRQVLREMSRLRVQGSRVREWQIKRKDGSEIQVEVSAQMLPDGRFQGIMRDITERRQLEREVARLDRLNMVGQMAAGIGHEVRNPMTTVRGFLQLFGRKPEFEHYKEYIDVMTEELDRANSIISEFLSLAKNKAVSLENANLNDVIKVILPLVQADAIMNNKYVVSELGDIPKMLLDEKEIRQLILNLTRNGLEAMLPGTKLKIMTFMEADLVILAIEDQGCGIKPEVLDKLGTPFFTTKEQGTGLGLATCYSIAARHRATIDVESSPNGTTFFVRFAIA